MNQITPNMKDKIKEITDTMSENSEDW